MGRPSDFTQEKADAICERLIEGESLRSICRDDDMPNAATVCRWLARPDRDDFRQQYTKAREAQADTLFDEMLDIADTQRLGEKRTVKANGDIEIVQADMVEHRKLQIAARQWMAGKMRPKKYGEKTLLGSDPDNPLPSIDDATLGRLIAFQLTKASREAG